MSLSRWAFIAVFRRRRGMPGGDLRRNVDEGAHQRKPLALLEAHDVFADREIRVGHMDRAEASIVAELALEHDTDAETRRHRLAHGLARLHLDQGAGPQPGFGEAGLE